MHHIPNLQLLREAIDGDHGDEQQRLACALAADYFGRLDTAGIVATMATRIALYCGLDFAAQAAVGNYAATADSSPEGVHCFETLLRGAVRHILRRDRALLN